MVVSLQERAAATSPATSADVARVRPSSPTMPLRGLMPRTRGESSSLRTAIAWLVHGVVGMQPAQFPGDLLEVGDEFIAGDDDVAREVRGQGAVAPSDQQLGAAAHAAVSVQRHHDVDVVEEVRKQR